MVGKILKKNETKTVKTPYIKQKCQNPTCRAYFSKGVTSPLCFKCSIPRFEARWSRNDVKCNICDKTFNFTLDEKTSHMNQCLALCCFCGYHATSNLDKTEHEKTCKTCAILENDDEEMLQLLKKVHDEELVIAKAEEEEFKKQQETREIEYIILNDDDDD